MVKGMPHLVLLKETDSNKLERADLIASIHRLHLVQSPIKLSMGHGASGV